MGRIRIRKANESDKTEISSIQNSFTSVKDNGFFKDFLHNDLYSQYDFEVWVAIIDMEVVGFSYVWSMELLPQKGIFKSFIESIPKQYYKRKALRDLNVFIFSPIYLCKNWQKGVYKRLLEKIKILKRDDYDLGITFIHYDDPLILNEHIEDLDMNLLHPFFYDNEGYDIVCFGLND